MGIHYLITVFIELPVAYDQNHGLLVRGEAI